MHRFGQVGHVRLHDGYSIQNTCRVRALPKLLKKQHGVIHSDDCGAIHGRQEIEGLRSRSAPDVDDSGA